MSGISKLAKTAETGLRKSIIYKHNFLISFFSGIFSLVVQLVFWPVYYNSGSDLSFSSIKTITISGYYLDEMITYSIIIYFIQRGTNMMNLSNSIKEDIMSGGINKYLLRPTKYLWNKWIFTISEQAISIAYSFIILIGSLLIFRNYLIRPTDIRQGGLILFFVISSYILSFLINCIIGVLSFWMLETHALSNLLNVLISVLSGGLFPIDMLTDRLKILLTYLPFSFMAFVPAQIYLGKMSMDTIQHNIIICTMWIIVLILLLNNLWKKGIRRYSAFGG